MTAIGIIGAGRAAALHAAATETAPDAGLVGIAGRRPGDAAELASQAGASDLSIEELITRSDAIVVAVPPVDAPSVLEQIGSRVGAVLVETPSACSTPQLAELPDRPPTMIGANILHAPATRRALAEIAKMTTPHHFALRSRSPRPDWGSHASPEFGGGAILDPGLRVLPVLLAAIAAPINTVSADMGLDIRRIDDRASLSFVTAAKHQRDVTMEIAWDDVDPMVELEVASDDSVVQLRLSTSPSLEVDGELVGIPGGDNPFFDLGYTDQIARLVAVAARSAAPWPGYELASGLINIATAAAHSATHQGVDVEPGIGYAPRSVWQTLGGVRDI